MGQGDPVLEAGGDDRFPFQNVFLAEFFILQKTVFSEAVDHFLNDIFFCLRLQIQNDAAGVDTLFDHGADLLAVFRRKDFSGSVKVILADLFRIRQFLQTFQILMQCHDGFKHDGTDERDFVRVGFKHKFLRTLGQGKGEIVLADLKHPGIFVQMGKHVPFGFQIFDEAAEHKVRDHRRGEGESGVDN